ncbi:unnamed protein product [Merluccius merluccius]
MMLSHPGEFCPSTDTESKKLNIVLLGCRGAGKTSSGNTLLGEALFSPGRTARCAWRRADMAGRTLTVVDTPGWWKSATVDDTAELIKQELVCSPSRGPALGPPHHAFLLVIPSDVPFQEDFRISVREHMGLLGPSVWSHTVVVFTCGDRRSVALEKYIQQGGEALQWVLGKCGHRYGILDNKKMAVGGTQATELLGTIEEMLAGEEESGLHYEVDRELVEEVEGLRREQQRGARLRLRKVQSERERQSTMMKLTILMLGHRRSGKSSSGNTILGAEGRGQCFQLGTLHANMQQQGEMEGWRVAVVDTPGWRMCKPPEEAGADHRPNEAVVRRGVTEGVSLCPHAILVCVRADVTYGEDTWRAAGGHLLPLLDSCWSRTLVLLTHGDCLAGRATEQHIQRAGRGLWALLEKCSNRYHVMDNKTMGGTQVRELLLKIEEMLVGNW